MRFGTLKVFTGTILFLLLSALVSPMGMAQETELDQTPPMNEANCPEAYRGEVISINIDDDQVTIELPDGEEEVLDLSLIRQASLDVELGDELVVCQDGTVTVVSEENMEATGDDADLRDRVAETSRRLEEEEEARQIRAIGSSAGMAQDRDSDQEDMEWDQVSAINEANCPEAYRGEVIGISNEWVTLETPDGEKELLDLSRTEQSLLEVAQGNELVVCEDGTVTVPVENMTAMGDDGGLRDRIAETFRRLEEEEAERRRAAARELEQMRMERMRTQPAPARVVPATTPVPMNEPVRVEPARPAPAPQPVRALW